MQKTKKITQIATLSGLLILTLVAMSLLQDKDLARAKKLAQTILITDGHIDIPYRLQNTLMKSNLFEDISVRTDSGDYDYVRSKNGGLDAPFMSIYVPAELQKTPGASKAHALAAIDVVNKIIADHPNKFAAANSSSEVLNNFKKGLISLPMGMENGSGIEDNLDNLNFFYDKGIRYITLTHSKNNLICDSSYDNQEKWQGLSPFGEKVVQRMNKLGIMIDVSHLSDEAIIDVLKLTQTPVIASHSSLRHFTPGFERNLSDDLVQKIAKNGGIIMINFGSDFISQKSRDSAKKITSHFSSWRYKNPSATESESLAKKEALHNEFYVYATVKDVADHIDHIKNTVGIDVIGLGSDFDGVGNTLPIGLKDAEQLPNLIAELLKRNYSQEEIEKIAYKNLFRVWDSVEAYSKQ